MKRDRRTRRIVLLACAMLPLAIGLAYRSAAQAPASGAPEKRALIVAISSYAQSTGWGPTSADRDVPLVRDALQRHGFRPSNIPDLRDAAATREGILKAVKEKLLDPASPGDVLVLHYSGHGQQITDDGNDEPDGYDETIVPYDAPLAPAPGYTGARHLRDDALSELMQSMRQKVGPSGNVVAFFDSCFSGTISRGLAPVRGGPPLGPPKPTASAARGLREATGFLETTVARGAGAAAPANLAPYVVMSAAPYDQYAWEMRNPAGQLVGPLSYWLSAALSKAGPGLTYRTLYEDVQKEMQTGITKNEPQIEGNIDAEIFGGRAVRQLPFVAVAKVLEGGSQVALSGGTLLGLNRGTKVELHAAGATARTDNTKLAEAEIVGATPLTATAKLTASVAPAKLDRSRAFVTRYTFGSLRMRASLKPVTDAALRSRIEAALGPIAAVEVSDADPEVIVALDPQKRELVVQNAETGLAILGPLAAHTANLSDQVANRLQDYARNRYLRGLSLANERLAVRLEVLPVRLSHCSDESQPTEDTCQVTRLKASDLVSGGHQLTAPVGSFFKLRLLPAPSTAYVAVLDLAPDGKIDVMWPPAGSKQPVKPGPWRELEGLWRFSEPLGLEVFMVVATEGYADFSPFRSAPSLTARGPVDRGALGAFGPLFDDVGIRTRAEAVVPVGAVNTDFVTIRVTPATAAGASN